MTTATLKKGDRIRVDIPRGAVYEATDAAGRIYSGATTRVSDGNGSNHLLYLGSDKIITKKLDPVVGVGTIAANFEAELIGDPGAGQLGTTLIRETDGGRFSHFVYLPSPAISVVELTPREGKPAPLPVFDRNSVTIDMGAVEDRIEELNEQQAFTVVRVRNGEIIESNFGSREDAGQYILDEDYNPERVIVREEGLDEDSRLQLEKLTELCEAVGSSVVTLYNDSYFDAEWAKAQFTGESGLRREQTNEWPLNLVDWSDAAVDRRELDYPYAYPFDGVTFYSTD